jgi:hypothetical protein
MHAVSMLLQRYWINRTTLEGYSNGALYVLNRYKQSSEAVDKGRLEELILGLVTLSPRQALLRYSSRNRMGAVIPNLEQPDGAAFPRVRLLIIENLRLFGLARIDI